MPARGKGRAIKQAKDNNWIDNQLFTTGQAAKICKVSQQTIIRSFDSGRLNGFRVPGSRVRRIPRADLLRFMKANEIPTDLLEGRVKRVLLVDSPESRLDLIRVMLDRDERFQVETVRSGYDAGRETVRFRPQLIVLVPSLPDLDGRVLCQRVRSIPDLADTKVLVATTSQGADADTLAANGADGFIEDMFEEDEIVAQVEELLQM